MNLIKKMKEKVSNKIYALQAALVVALMSATPAFAAESALGTKLTDASKAIFKADTVNTVGNGLVGVALILFLVGGIKWIQTSAWTETSKFVYGGLAVGAIGMGLTPLLTAIGITIG